MVDFTTTEMQKWVDEEISRCRSPDEVELRITLSEKFIELLKTDRTVCVTHTQAITAHLTLVERLRERRLSGSIS